MLGPSCTYATFQLVEWVWLCLSLLIIYHYQLTNVWLFTLLSASVMKLAWTWAFPSSLLGASACLVIIRRNWPEFCPRHARPQTYYSTLWMKLYHLRMLGSRSMFTRSTATQVRTASGETGCSSPEWPLQLHSVLQHVPLFCLICLLLSRVHQRIGSSLCQLCIRYTKKDAAWGGRAVQCPYLWQKIQQQWVFLNFELHLSALSISSWSMSFFQQSLTNQMTEKHNLMSTLEMNKLSNWTLAWN